MKEGPKLTQHYHSGLVLSCTGGNPLRVRINFLIVRARTCPKVLETKLLSKKDPVLQFTTLKIKKIPTEHGSEGTGTSQQFFLLLEELLTGTGPRQRQVKWHSFHWQNVPSPPFSQGRICSVTIQTHGEGGNALSALSHIQYPARVWSEDLNKVTLPRHVGQGYWVCTAASAAKTIQKEHQASHTHWLPWTNIPLQQQLGQQWSRDWGSSQPQAPGICEGGAISRGTKHRVGIGRRRV